MRLIDADDFMIKAMSVSYPVTHGYNEQESGITMYGLAQLLDEQPTVETMSENREWILVTERLPDSDYYVWVSCETLFGANRVDIGIYCGHWVDQRYGELYGVKAWMPFYPEPYKEE